MEALRYPQLCDSYVFMSAGYGQRIDQGNWEKALFTLTNMARHVKTDQSVFDAGLKVQAVDSGLLVVFGREDVTYIKCSDKHGVIDDPHERNSKIEGLWPGSTWG